MRTLVEWITELVPLEYILDGRYELIMDLLIHIYPFDAAATLARVEDGAIYNLFRGPLDIDVRSHICGILASKLKTYAKRNSIICSALDRETIRYRTGKADKLDLWRPCYGLDLDYGPTVKYLEHTIRQSSLFEDLLDLLGTGWRLRGRLQYY